MATYTVPQMRIFQEFTQSTASSTATLAACLVGPNYGEFTADVGDYAGLAISHAYPGLSGYHSIADADLPEFQCKLKNARIAYDTFTDADGDVVFSGSTITASFPLADTIADPLPEPFAKYVAGDKVYFNTTPVTSATILRFAPVDLALDSVKAAVQTSQSATAAISAAATSELTANQHIIIHMSTAFTAGTDTGAFVAYDQNGRVLETYSGSMAGAIPIGSTNISVTLAGSWMPGDVAVVGGTMAGVAVPNAMAILDGAIPVAATTAAFTHAQDITLTTVTTTPTASDGEVQFSASSVTIPADLEYQGFPIMGGEVEIRFKALSTNYANAMVTLTNQQEVIDLLGAPSDGNPLAKMASIALANSNNTAVHCVATAEESVEGYAAALAALEEASEPYSIVPYAQDKDIQDTVAAWVNAMSSPTNMKWKICWLAYDLPTTVTALDTFAITSNGTNTVAAAVGTDLSGIVVNDILTLSATGISVRITGVAVDTRTITTAQALPTLSAVDAVITHATTGAEAAAAAVAACTWNDRRVRMVVGVGVASSVYTAAACAGLRSGSAPHQPLTRAELVNLTLAPRTLASTALDTMAAAGIWLVACSNAGIPFIRHQLTTDKDNYSTREDSKVTNADEISLFMRAQLSNYYGRANISDEFITLLYAKVITFVDVIRARRYSSLLGPQVLTATPPVIERSLELADKLNVYVQYTTPDPMNYLDVYLTIS